MWFGAVSAVTLTGNALPGLDVTSTFTLAPRLIAPSVLAIVEALAAEPASVAVLADRFPISRPAVSRHLKPLKETGLVDSISDGTRRIYRVRPEGIAELREYLEQPWREAATRYTLVAGNLSEPNR